jgi:hypothetical protein
MMPVQTSKTTGMNNFKTIIPYFTRFIELEARHQPPSPVSARHISNAKLLIGALFNGHKFALNLKEEIINPSPKKDLMTTAPAMNRKMDAIIRCLELARVRLRVPGEEGMLTWDWEAGFGRRI